MTTSQPESERSEVESEADRLIHDMPEDELNVSAWEFRPET
ncbi:hypothetical protein ACIPY3_03105 [Paenarthrobacter sp. NPDC089714]